MTTNEVAHLSPEQMVAISDAHSDGNGVIVNRVRAVQAGLASGVTVKIMTADLHDAAAAGTPGIVPVSQVTLGRAAAVVRVLDGAGITVASAIKANPGAVADTYRAIDRHGIKTVSKTLIQAATDGGTAVPEKMAALGRVASAAVEKAIKARKAAGPRRSAQEPAAGESTRSGVLADRLLKAAHDVEAGSLQLTADEIATLAAAVATMASVLESATPRPVAAPKATAKA